MESRLPMARLRDFAIALARRSELDRDEWSGPAYFVGIVDSDEDGLTVAVHPVEPPDAHPSELLPYLEVPDDWLALGLVAFGWARSLDDWDAPRRRAHTVDLFDRRGAGVAVIDR